MNQEGTILEYDEGDTDTFIRKLADHHGRTVSSDPRPFVLINQGTRNSMIMMMVMLTMIENMGLGNTLIWNSIAFFMLYQILTIKSSCRTVVARLGLHGKTHNRFSQWQKVSREDFS